MSITLSNELTEQLEAIAAQENRSPEAVLQTMIAQYQPVTQPQKSEQTPREILRAKLLKANALVTQIKAPVNAVRLSVEERMKLGKLPDSAPSSLDLINQDRCEW